MQAIAKRGNGFAGGALAENLSRPNSSIQTLSVIEHSQQWLGRLSPEASEDRGDSRRRPLVDVAELLAQKGNNVGVVDAAERFGASQFDVAVFAGVAHRLNQWDRRRGLAKRAQGMGGTGARTPTPGIANRLNISIGKTEAPNRSDQAVIRFALFLTELNLHLRVEHLGIKRVAHVEEKLVESFVLRGPRLCQQLSQPVGLTFEATARKSA